MKNNKLSRKERKRELKYQKQAVKFRCLELALPKSDTFSSLLSNAKTIEDYLKDE